MREGLWSIRARETTHLLYGPKGTNSITKTELNTKTFGTKHGLKTNNFNLTKSLLASFMYTLHNLLELFVNLMVVVINRIDP